MSCLKVRVNRLKAEAIPFLSNQKGRITNKGFTALQLIFTVAIILVLVSIASLSYKKILEMSREKVCATNQQALTNAVEAYVSSNNYVIPAVLGNLKLKHLKTGYAQVMKKAGWSTLFAHFIVRTSMSSEAYAQFLTYDNLKNYGVSQDFFLCPSDPNGGISYGINANIAGKPWYQISDNVIIVGDCDSHTFSSQGELRKRHGSGKVAIVVTKQGAVAKIEDGSVTSDTDNTDPAFDDDGDDYDIDDDSFDEVQEGLQTIFDENTGILQARAQNIITMIQSAKAKVKSGQMMEAVSGLEAAIGVVQTTVGEGLLDSTKGQAIIDKLESKAEIIRNL